MSYWNYRVVEVDRDGEPEFGVYEVYYDDNGRAHSRTEDPASFVGDSWQEVAEAVAAASIGLGMPAMKDSEIGARP